VGVAIVIGASGAIGHAIAQRLALHDGLDLICCSRSVENFVRPSVGPGRVEVQALDVTSDSSVVSLRELIGARSVVLLVNAVGSDLEETGDGTPVMGVDETRVRRDLELKLFGLLRLVRGLEDRLDEGAKIVSIGGNLGVEPLGDTGGIGIADAALSNMVRQMSKSGQNHRRSVHVIAPGPVRSPRIAKLVEMQQSAELAAGREFNRESAERALKLVEPDDVAWLVDALFTGAGSAMTGGTLLIDNGLRMGTP
jgi:3-oxoacyl-[acyl-carrier protein] reductase